MWLAGGGTRPGVTIGRTDDLGDNVVEDPVDVHDLHATMLAAAAPFYRAFKWCYRSTPEAYRAGYFAPTLLRNSWICFTASSILMSIAILPYLTSD